MSGLDEQTFPKGILIAAAMMILAAVMTAATSRWTGIGVTRMSESAVVESRLLRFDDRTDGAVVVSSSPESRVLAVLEPGTHGFIRSVLRGLARERRLQGIGSDPPFELTRWNDGRISLADRGTGRRIELDAFGPTNAAAFSALLHAGEAERGGVATLTRVGGG